MKKLILLIFLAAVIYTTNLYADEILKNYIQEALKNNPDLITAREEVERRKQIPDRVSSLADPVLKYELSNTPVSDLLATDKTPMSGHQIMLSQHIPAKGKLDLKYKAAYQDVKITRYFVEELQNKVIKELKKSYYEIYFLKQAIRITDKNKQILKDYFKISNTKYSVGKGLQQDVLKAQVELSKIEDKLINLNKNLKITTVYFNSLLGREVTTPVNISENINIENINLDFKKYKETFESSRPILKIADEKIKKAQILNKLALKEYKPDYTLGFGYRIRDSIAGDPVRGKDFLSLSLSINLPVYTKTKQDKYFKETEKLISVENKSKQSKIIELDYKVKKLIDEVEADKNLIVLYETGIIPQAEQSLQSALSGYQVDKIDFITLLNNYLVLFNYEIQLEREKTKYLKNISELEYEIGKILN